MRKAQKKQAEDFVTLLGQAHDEIRNMMEQKKNAIAMDLLGQCQEGAIQLSNFIEKIEGQGNEALSVLEEYCKVVYEVYEELRWGLYDGSGSAYEKLQKSWNLIKNSVRDSLKVRLEIVFLPYKASMWDSLESIWMASDADPDCSAYVVPIPYYERGADGSPVKYHYEGGDMPDYVPVTHYDSYHIQERRPDIIYIHNPYDQGNYITSVDPRYYSPELKKYTDLLVYVPYYATSGGMSEGQALCSAYLNVDYIVVQAEKYREFFDPVVPREKLLPLGSPKFDRVIRMCMNPPEPPAGWKKDMAGKTVYFYNTSINGMLSDTRRFLMKMEYVFRCFRGREDACLLWRPHPLLDSTFGSMRKEYKTVYDKLKHCFIQDHLGIYDDTPDIEKTIALSDVYIGDAGTSVTALFGIAGKPLFILNNFINTLPEADDWRGETVRGFFPDGCNDGQDEWLVIQGNKLYHSPGRDYQYEFYCDLSEYTSGCYYLRAVEIDGNIYVCPQNAQDILVVSGRRIVKRVELVRRIEQSGAFCNAWRIGNYLFLIPNLYPAVVRYDVRNGRLDYLEGYNDVFVKNVQGERRIGGSCIWNGRLLLASPADNKVLVVDGTSLDVELLTAGEKGGYGPGSGCGAGNKDRDGRRGGNGTGGGYGTEVGSGCVGMTPYDGGICMLPYTGATVTCWNPETGASAEYTDMPEGFQCNNRPLGFRCMELPFGLAAIYGNRIVLPPLWGNMFISIDMGTGSAQEWKPPFPVSREGRNGYFQSWSVGAFLGRTDTLGEGTFRFYYEVERKLYDINLGTGEFKEIGITFNQEELLGHEPGFGRCSDWLKYGCEEKAMYSLEDFLEGVDRGRPFDRGEQMRAYGEITANSDGTCGQRIHQFACANV